MDLAEHSGFMNIIEETSYKSNWITTYCIKSNVSLLWEVKTRVPVQKPLRTEQKSIKVSPHVTMGQEIKLQQYWWKESATQKNMMKMKMIIVMTSNHMT